MGYGDLSMEEKQKTEINQVLSPEAKDKLSEISVRIKLSRESLNIISKPQEKKPSMILRVIVGIILLPILFLLFIVTGYLGIWLILNPLNTTQIYGISIILIGCYVVFLNQKGSKNGK